MRQVCDRRLLLSLFTVCVEPTSLLHGCSVRANPTAERLFCCESRSAAAAAAPVELWPPFSAACGCKLDVGRGAERTRRTKKLLMTHELVVRVH